MDFKKALRYWVLNEGNKMLKINLERKSSDSEKWGKYKNTDILPMWVADSEFEAPEVVKEALQKRLNHGVFGYAYLTDEFKEAVVNHCQRRYNWTIQPEWVVWFNGVVPALNLARAVSIARGKKEGLTLEPVYPHLRKNSPILDFKNVGSGFILEGDRYRPDFKALRANIHSNTGLLLLCHPHNPLGLNYSPAELNEFANIAKEHDLIVCSDEIHCDLILDDTQHRPFASLNEDTANRTITLMATSKTYNIAGLCSSFGIIPNPELRAEIARLRVGLVGDTNVFGQVATITALNHGEEWRQAHLQYLRENAEIVYQRINATGLLKTTPVKATFMAWIDARALNVPNPAKFFEQHGVGMNDGADFGLSGFVRLNFGCGREMLLEALQRIDNALSSLK